VPEIIINVPNIFIRIPFLATARTAWAAIYHKLVQSRGRWFYSVTTITHAIWDTYFRICDEFGMAFVTSRVSFVALSSLPIAACQFTIQQVCNFYWIIFLFAASSSVIICSIATSCIRWSWFKAWGSSRSRVLDARWSSEYKRKRKL